MKIAKEILIKESVLELKKLHAKQVSLYKQKRVACLLHIKTEKFKTRQELANYLGVHIRTQERWLVQYKKEGVSFLLNDESKVRVSKKVTPEIHQGLALRVNSSDKPFLGYWDAYNWVKEEYKVEIQYHWLRKYLIHHFKTKLKTPRKSHYKKDDQAVEAFLKTPKDSGPG